MNLQKQLATFAILVLGFRVQTQTISDRLNAFAIDLLKTTSAEPDITPNYVVSPYTIWSLLSIIDEGARGNTAEQLERALRIPNHVNKKSFRPEYHNLSSILSLKDPDLNLDIYNSIFTTALHKLNPEFQLLSQNTYRVDVQPIDFRNTGQASQIINQYVAQATRNRIQNFIHPDDVTDAYIFIVSALYFKGAWKLPFNRSQTYRDTFYDEKENKLGEVDMMYHMGFFPYTRLEDIKGYAVELPYGNGDKMSMIVILPYKDETIANMLRAMNHYPFSKILELLDKAKEDFEDDDVKVYLPRFGVKTDLNLNVVLYKMGIKDVFDETTADLLGMFHHYLYISRIVHRAEIDVNEEGTVASSASGAGLVNKSPPPKFLANRPFLYFIVHKPTKSIISAGQITSPP